MNLTSRKFDITTCLWSYSLWYRLHVLFLHCVLTLFDSVYRCRFLSRSWFTFSPMAYLTFFWTISNKQVKYGTPPRYLLTLQLILVIWQCDSTGSMSNFTAIYTRLRNCFAKLNIYVPIMIKELLLSWSSDTTTSPISTGSTVCRICHREITPVTGKNVTSCHAVRARLFLFLINLSPVFAQQRFDVKQISAISVIEQKE